MSERSEFRKKYIVEEGNWIKGYRYYFICPFCGEKVDITRPSSGGRPYPHYGVVVGHLNRHIKQYYERYLYHVERTPRKEYKFYRYRCKICGKDFRDRIGVVEHIVVSHFPSGFGRCGDESQ